MSTWCAHPDVLTLDGTRYCFVCGDNLTRQPMREAFKREAERRGESMTDALRRFIEGYVRGEK